MRIASFNLQNLRLHPEGLYGARDRDVAGEDAALDSRDRDLTARVIRETRADVIALQEVFDADSLDHFHDAFLASENTDWPHRVCLPGNDGRGLDVAVMSRRPLDRVRSHAGATPASLEIDPGPLDPAKPVFRRDCLEVAIGDLTLFVVHLKAPWPDAAAARPVRMAEARAVRALVEARFRDTGKDFWLVLGDLNDPDPPGAGNRSVAAIEEIATDLSRRLPPPERWTFRHPTTGERSMPDAMLASPALARRWPEAVPEILRAGLGREAGRRAGARYAVGEHRPHASDHAALVIDLPGL